MSRDESTLKRFPDRVWWIGVVVATSLVVLSGVTMDLFPLPPETPFDNTRSGHAEQWSFLQEASALLPAGSTFTIHAADPDTEMSLYMMAVGLLPQATAIPRTYYGQTVAASASARFVVAFGADAGDQSGAGRSIAIAGGTVTDRGPPQP